MAERTLSDKTVRALQGTRSGEIMPKNSEFAELKFSQDDLDALLRNCEDYIDQRRKELDGPLSAGVKLDTWDPYLIGYTTGMRAGLEMASNLVASYSEWVRRKIYHPDAIYPWK